MGKASLMRNHYLKYPYLIKSCNFTDDFMFTDFYLNFNVTTDARLRWEYTEFNKKKNSKKNFKLATTYK